MLEALEPAKKYRVKVLQEEVDPQNDQGYWELLCRVWELCGHARQDLWVVEHDIVINPQVWDSFAECEGQFCSYPYWIGSSWCHALGCVRIRWRLIREEQDAMVTAGRRMNDGIPIVGYWKRLDVRFTGEMLDRGHRSCKHEPPVIHRHEYPMLEPTWSG